jgi:hypothetical protein
MRPFVRTEGSGKGFVFVPSSLFITDPFAATHFNSQKVAGRKTAARGTEQTVSDRPTPRTQMDGELGAAGIRDLVLRFSI